MSPVGEVRRTDLTVEGINIAPSLDDGILFLSKVNGHLDCVDLLPKMSWRRGSREEAGGGERERFSVRLRPARSCTVTLDDSTVLWPRFSRPEAEAEAEYSLSRVKGVESG